jgi:outer membrane protein assembly factor BamB
MHWRCWRTALRWYVCLIPLVCYGQSWERFSEGLISCDDRAAIISVPGAGISYVSLDSGRRKWRAMNDNTPQVGPFAAGDTVAVIADAFNTIYAFSKTTGKRLWTKDIWANRLASDGRYFYVVRTAYWDLEALDPASGNLVWSLQLPDFGPGYLPFLIVHDGLLFALDLVIDLSKRAIVHQWRRESFFLDRVAFGDDGSIFLVGTSGTQGMIAIYDKNFNQIGRLVAGKGRIREVVPPGEQILALLEQADPYGTWSTLALLTRKGKRLWAIRWHSGIRGFSVLGGNLLMMEPGKMSGKHRLTSRQLSTGKLNWTTASRALFGIPAVCGDTVYATDGNRLHRFDLHTGKEMTSVGVARH